MKAMQVALALILIVCPTHAQPYGWVQVAQVGDQFTSLRAVEFLDSLHGWLYGSRVNYLYTFDGGLTWNQATSAGFAATSISMVDTSTGWAVGNGINEGGIGKTTNGGRSWIQQSLHLDRAYVGTSSLSILKNITSGQTYSFSPDTGKVVQTTDGGLTWAERTIADSLRQLTKVQFVDSLHGWIISTSGLMRTNDGGNVWSLVSPTPSTTQAIKAISFIDTLRGWAIGNPAQVYHTTDGGVTWQDQFCICSVDDELGPTALSFVDSLNGWAFGNIFYQGDLAAAIYRTTNGGTSWYREHVGLTRYLGDGLMVDLHHGWAIGDAGVVLAYRPATSAPERLPELPKQFSLRQNYPNPFNPATNIEYEVVKLSSVRIAVYDITGKEMCCLVNSEHEPGVYRVRFDTSNLASGIYYYAMKTETFSETRRMVLVK